MIRTTLACIALILLAWTLGGIWSTAQVARAGAQAKPAVMSCDIGTRVEAGR